MKKWVPCVVTLTLVFGAFALFAWPLPSPDDPRIYGPVRCVNCPVQAPIADDITQAFLKTYGTRIGYKGHDATFFPGTGARFIVCNLEMCTTYQLSDNHHWHGIEQKRITPPRPRPDKELETGSGGAVDRAEQGGGFATGPGAWSPGNGGGSVTVGKMQKL